MQSSPGEWPTKGPDGMPVLQAVRQAPGAARWLAETTSARVLSVFDRACNLISSDGAVLALVTSERGLTPFGLVVEADDPAPFRGVPASSTVWLARPERVLSVGLLQVRYAEAAVWEARPDWAALRTLFADSQGPLGGLADLAEAVTLQGSLLDLYRTRNSSDPLAQAMLARARRGAKRLVQGLARRDQAEAMAGAQTLAGVGGGLTPAGDDFIVGTLLAAWAGLYGDGATALAPALAEAAASRTSTLSAAYLRAAAQGECSAHWHTLFAGLVQGDRTAAQAAVSALVSIGHTSGADALAGFLAIHYEPWLGRAPAQPAGGHHAHLD